MPDLILRPSDYVPGKPWALQLYYRDCPSPTAFYTITHVSNDIARDIVRAGAAVWLRGISNERAPDQCPSPP